VVHQFEILSREPWINPLLEKAGLLMMCQDQVVQLPPGATVLARSALVPNAMILVGTNMLGIQGHPEFSVDFEEKLIGINSKYLAPGQAEAGIKSLTNPLNSTEVDRWMARFYRK
jgi:GMP synthase-like glutamine amidotransferase